MTRISRDESPNMERTSMLTKDAIHGKPFGVALGFPIPSQEDFTSQKEGKDMNPKPGFSYVFLSL